VNAFEPRTFSTDWEVMVVDRLERTVSTWRCRAFANALRAELDLPVHVDMAAIEFGMGVNSSFEQFWYRTRRATDRAAEMVRELDLDLFPAGAHPVSALFNSSHVHVGSIHSETEGIHLENQVLRYVPAFAALAANSPYWNRRRGDYKSYRVRHRADGCTAPSSVRDPAMSQRTWGSDAAPKVYLAPTMEVRIPDCASSRRFLAEMTTFVAAFLHQEGERISGAQPTPQEYRDILTNRWAAARHGMQATFVWDGGTRPVAEVLGGMLDGCREALGRLGTSPERLRIVQTMLRKRVCQADFALQLSSRYPDPYLLCSAYSKLVRCWEVFDEYLESAPILEPAPAPDEEAVVAEHLAHIGEGTHFYSLRRVMSYPPPITDEIIEHMAREGLITREITPRGLLLHKRKA
jgi:gamma-glutamyl:cysteine ligase YbdK (ATP-grasp superfamily)